MKVVISFTDYLHYDYVYVPKNAELEIQKLIDASLSWRNKYHKGEKDVWIGMHKGKTTGTTAKPINARIKMPKSKASIALSYIKGLR